MKMSNLLMLMISMTPMFMILINSIFFHNKLIHPIFIGIILFFLTVISMFPLSMYTSSPLISYIVFLVLIGGMMIMFLYFVSFINNMKISINISNIYSILFKMILMMIMLFYSFSYETYPWYCSNIDTMTIFQISNWFSHYYLLFMFFKNKYYTIIFLMFYLLLNLTTIVKMCMKKKKTLRMIN